MAMAMGMAEVQAVQVSNTFDIMGFFNHHQHIIFSAVSGAIVSIFSEATERFLGTGFFFSRDSEVVTARHIVEGLQRVSVFLGFPGHGATRCDVMDVIYSDDADLDVAVLRGTMKSDCFLLATGSFRTGDTGYVFGFDTDHLLKMSAGIITLTGEQVFGKVQEAFVACLADDGYSGGPVTDYEGRVKGMVVGGRGRSMLSTTFIPSASIHTAVYNILLHQGAART